jgi:hypothetical protein
MFSPVRSLALLLILAAPATARAQRWVSGTELALVRQASAQRKALATDTALASWRATARGLVRLGPVTEQGSVPSAKSAKADELIVTVYGRLPDRIKQVIGHWTDTVLAPSMAMPRYHRDHLGIVSSDFGDRIRLGDGEEVRNLIHPLSSEGLDYYEFAVGDTMRIRAAQEVILVVPVSVRPRDPKSPGTIGTLYIDPDRRVLVRFRFTFTPESYIDRSVIDITVTLESSLLNSTHWLPSRQSIVVRRQGRENGMLRADWEIGNYIIGERSADSLFRQGPDSFPAVGGLRGVRGSLSGDTTVETVLTVTPRPDAGVRATAQEASKMVGGRSLQGGRRRNRVLFADDIVTVNRVQGYTFYPGMAFPVGQSLTLSLRPGYGFADRQMFGSARLEGPVGLAAWRLEGERAMQDVGDVRQYDGPLSFLYPVMSGRDPGDWTRISRGMFGLRFPLRDFQFTLDGGMEHSESVVTQYTKRDFDRPNPALGAGTAAVGRMSVGRRWSDANEIGVRVEVGRGDADWQRIAANMKLHQSLAKGRVVLALSGGVGSAGLPGYRNFVLGGPSTLPGVDDRSLGGRSMALADLSYERRFSIWRLLGIGGSQNRPGGANTVAPFVAAGLAGGDQPLLPWRGTNVVAYSVGLRFNIGGLVIPAGVQVP